MLPEKSSSGLRFRKWIVVLLALALSSDAFGDREAKADAIVIHKSERELLVLKEGKVLMSYRVALGRNPIGAKQREGDGKTPEGEYRISGRNAMSAFHKSLRISYPDAVDRSRAAKEGVRPGGDIIIHGLPNGQGHIGAAHRLTDWTEG